MHPAVRMVLISSFALGAGILIGQSLVSDHMMAHVRRNVKRLQVIEVSTHIIQLGKMLEALRNGTVTDARGIVMDRMLQSMKELDAIRGEMDEGDLYYYLPAKEYAAGILAEELKKSADKAAGPFDPRP